ncbi:MAG: hypothetical protein QXF56_04155 [Candidatus Micrarchaeia archaeon]
MAIEKQEEAKRAERELMTVKLTLAVDDIRRQAHFYNSVHVFGINGVGAIISDRVCVKVDGRKAEVWLSEGLYSALYEKSKQPHLIKEELRKPDEKILGDYTPIFKALSNCGISIQEVNRSSLEKLLEVKMNLEAQHDIISSLKSTFRNEAYLISEYGPVAVAEARERYEKNKLPTPEVKKQLDFRSQLEWVLFEKELAQQLKEISEYEVFKVLTTPNGERVNIHGNRGIGVVAAPFLVMQIDKNEAKVFLEQSEFSKFSAHVGRKTVKEICEEVQNNPKLSEEKLRSLPSLLAALSETKISVSELSGKTTGELKETAEKLVEQNWIASQLLKVVEAPQVVLEQLLESVSLKKVQDTIARYGLEIAVEQKKKTHEPSEKLSKKISEKLRLLEFGMVDEKVDGIEILGMAGFFAINVKDDAVIKVKGDRASVLLTKEFSSILSEHVRSRKEFETLQKTQQFFYPDTDLLSFKYPQLLEGDKRFLSYLSVIEALKEHGVKSASFKTVTHNAGYYIEKVRREFDIPSQFSHKLKEGRNFAEVVDEMLKTLPASELVAKLENAGMQKEAEEVANYVDALRSTKKKVREMLDEWVGKGVPEKKELIGRINPEVLERTLKEEIAEMTESNEKLSSRIQVWRKKLNEPRHFGSASQDVLNEFIRDDSKAIEENKRKIEKAKEALKVLEEKNEP